ncbi:PsbP-related protein [Candidatus Nitrosocosmicus sp. R]
MSIRKVNTIIFALPCVLLLFLFSWFGHNSLIETTQDLSLFSVNKALAQEIFWSNYTTDDNTLSIAYPTNWKIVEDKKNNENQTNDIIVFLSPKESPKDPFQENIVVNIMIPKNNFTINESINTQDIVQKLVDQNQGFRFDNISTIHIDSINKTADSITYSFENAGFLFKTKQIFLTINNNIYIFSLLAEQKEFDKYASIFDKMLMSIHLSI